MAPLLVDGVENCELRRLKCALKWMDIPFRVTPYQGRRHAAVTTRSDTHAPRGPPTARSCGAVSAARAFGFRWSVRGARPVAGQAALHSEGCPPRCCDEHLAGPIARPDSLVMRRNKSIPVAFYFFFWLYFLRCQKGILGRWDHADTSHQLLQRYPAALR